MRSLADTPEGSRPPRNRSASTRSARRHPSTTAPHRRPARPEIRRTRLRHRRQLPVRRSRRRAPRRPSRPRRKPRRTSGTDRPSTTRPKPQPQRPPRTRPRLRAEPAPSRDYLTAAPPRRIERPTNGLGTARDRSAIVLESAEEDQLRADCRALLIAVADGDGEAAAIALDAMRRAARLDTVERALAVAADVLITTAAIETRTGS